MPADEPNKSNDDYLLPGDPLSLITAIEGLRMALRRSLTALAKSHGNTEGEWLDELENSIQNDIKEMQTSETRLEVEHTAIAHSLALVTTALDELRTAFRRP